MSKIRDEKRKEIWDKFCDIESKLREAKFIVGNPLDITDEVMNGCKENLRNISLSATKIGEEIDVARGEN